MAVDTVAKRMAVASVPCSAFGIGVYPGTTSTILGRSATAWNFATSTPTPPVGDGSEDTLIICGMIPTGTVRQLHATSVGSGSWLE